jgi:L-cystine uptake protein TcyP (sodium:dicarboxylate symporter family)
MDYSFSIIVFYTVILGLVAPYIFAKSEEYGAMLPPAIALVTGGTLWAALTWLGFKYTDGYIWVIIMVVMPLVMAFVSSRIAHARIKAREEKLRG